MNVTEELERVGIGLIADTKGIPVGAIEPRVRLTERRDGMPVVRLFVSYAHADDQLTHKLVDDLTPRLASSSKYCFEIWQDVQLQPGEDWDGRIRGALHEAHLGLMLLTPAFFSSNYIKNVEIPEFVSGRATGVEGKRVIPVELELLEFSNTKMHGLDERQIFRGPPRDKHPFPRRKSSKRSIWMNELVKAIHHVLDTYADSDPQPPSRPPDRRTRRFNASHMLSKDLEEIEECDRLIAETKGQIAQLDESWLARPQTDESANSVFAVDYVMRWLQEPSSPSLFALLGEYGMGKTVTCQRVIRAVEMHNATAADRLPAPLYFDLRRLTSLRGREQVPHLTEILDECIERGWPLRGDKPSAEELLEQAAEAPVLFVFDGLDEALVHLSDVHGKEFTRELLRVRELSEGAGFKTRVLISCRTHYFRSLPEQEAHFTGQDRGRTKAVDYAALVLLPLGEEQIRGYLGRALPELDVGRAIELVRSVHNLQELAARPYTLQLIGEQIPAIEQLRARGETVRGVTLYGLMVGKWLTRDGGKHHIKPDHKLRLMSHLAAWTWARGSRLVPATELEDWFGAWLDSDPAMRRRYGNVDPDKLEEDLRTATFLVREDDKAGHHSGFRFAHTSMQEFFLSSYLFDALVDDAPELWGFEKVSPETWDFFAQRVGERGEGPLVARLSVWARGDRRATRWLVFRYVLLALERGWAMPNVVGIDLSDIELQGCAVRGPLDLSGSRWAGANLRQTRWVNVTLDGACFEQADLRFVEWERVSAKHVEFEGARADGGVFRRVALDGARGGGSGRRCSFIHTTPPSFWLEDVRVAPHVDDEHVHVRSLTLDARHRGAVRSCAWSHDGTRALSAGDDGTLRLWDVESGTSVGVWEGHGGGVSSCAWSPDGTRALSTGDDGTLRLWDVESGTSVGVWEGHGGGVSSCAWSPDGTRALSTGNDGTLRLWDVESGTSVGVWEGHGGGVSSCAWSPDGTRALSGGADGTLRLWDVESGTSVGVWEGHGGGVSSCAWSPDGTRALSGGNDGTLRLWDVKSGTSVGVWEGHRGWVSSCAWSPDGARVLSAGFDGTLRLWDAASGSTVAEWGGHRDSVFSCAWSPDGTRALSAGHDGRLRLWDVESGTSVGVWEGHRGWVS
ncbi:NACHT domain-containing protein, partial [Enhygromyxa salina]|uniref:NACHT domain-containing protein n=1 Tax=Enhygromyxa salina TaxID=215803 RepID=UPI0013FD09B0